MWYSVKFFSGYTGYWAGPILEGTKALSDPLPKHRVCSHLQFVDKPTRKHR